MINQLTNQASPGVEGGVEREWMYRTGVLLTSFPTSPDNAADKMGRSSVVKS